MSFFTNPAIYVPLGILAFLALIIFTPFRIAAIFTESQVRIKVAKITVYDSNKQKKKIAKKPDAGIKERLENKVMEQLGALHTAHTTAEKKKITLSDLVRYQGTLSKMYKDEQADVFKLFKQLKNVSKLVYYRVRIRFGFENAADTGIATGIICASICSTEAFVRNFLTPRQNSFISVTPDFTSPGLKIIGKIIIRTKLYNIFKVVGFGYTMYKSNYKKVVNIIKGGCENESSN